MNPRLLRPLATGFNPKSIADLAAWYDAQVASSVTIETGVSEWRDLSGNGRHATQTTGNNQPLRVTEAAVQGKHVIRFDGSNDSLVATFSLTKPLTIFCAAKFDSTPSNDTIYDGVTLNTVRLFAATSNTVAAIFAGAQLNSPTVSPGLSDAFFVHEAVFDSGSSSINSVNGTFTATGNAGTAAFGGLTFGAAGNLLSFGDVSIAEVIVYGRTLTSYWRSPGGIDRGEASPLAYAFHALVGHHGIFSLTPAWLLVIPGLLLLAGRDGGHSSSAPSTFRRRLAIAIAAVSLAVIIFYLSRPQIDRNYGGMTSGFRWAFWLAPLWVVAAVPAIDHLAGSRLGRGVALALLALSSLSVAFPTWNPWTLPWLHQWLIHVGWIPAL